MSAPQAADGSGSGVVTVVSSRLAHDAAEASSVARGLGESTLGATGAIEEDVSWPGADAASYLAYGAKLPMPSGQDVVFRSEFLTLDLRDGTQAVVTVVGPVEGFATERLHDVLATTTIS